MMKEHGLCLVLWDDHTSNDAAWYFDKDFSDLTIARLVNCGWVFEYEDRYVVMSLQDEKDSSFKHAQCIDKRMVVSINPLRIVGKYETQT